jgi:hypothetical protein
VRGARLRLATGSLALATRAAGRRPTRSALPRNWLAWEARTGSLVRFGSARPPDQAEEIHLDLAEKSDAAGQRLGGKGAHSREAS